MVCVVRVYIYGRVSKPVVQQFLNPSTLLFTLDQQSSPCYRELDSRNSFVTLAVAKLSLMSSLDYDVLRRTKTYYDVLRCSTTYYNVLRRTTTYNYNVLRRSTTYYDVLRRTTTYYDVLRRTTTRRTTTYYDVL